jgi:hypothetical protein
VAYTIGQSPLTRLIERYEIADLQKLQLHCYRSSMSLIDRDDRHPTALRVGILITYVSSLCLPTAKVTKKLLCCSGYFYNASVGRVHPAASLLAEACQIAYSLGLHRDDLDLSSSTNRIETEQRRRLFWHLYAVDM